MASSDPKTAMNTRQRQIKTESVRLSDVKARTTTAYVDLITGTGAPSGGYGRDAGATLLYFRQDASTVATAVYVSVDGGTGWTAMDPAALSGLDINGTELILDADADTSITADTDDEIDIRVAGADDFKILANIFRALSGSVVETNTINETTAGSGVTIDSLLVKDGQAQGTDITDPGDAGAIAVTRSGSVSLVTAGPAETRTLAIPTAIGQVITLFLQTDGGDCAITVASAINVAGNTVITFDTVNERITLLAYHNGVALAWTVLANDGAALS